MDNIKTSSRPSEGTGHNQCPNVPKVGRALPVEPATCVAKEVQDAVKEALGNYSHERFWNALKNAGKISQQQDDPIWMTAIESARLISIEEVYKSLICRPQETNGHEQIDEEAKELRRLENLTKSVVSTLNAPTELTNALADLWINHKFDAASLNADFVRCRLHGPDYTTDTIALAKRWAHYVRWSIIAPLLNFEPSKDLVPIVTKLLTEYIRRNIAVMEPLDGTSDSVGLMKEVARYNKKHPEDPIKVGLSSTDLSKFEEVFPDEQRLYSLRDEFELKPSKVVFETK